MANPQTGLQPAEAVKEEMVAVMVAKGAVRWAAVTVVASLVCISANPTMNWVLFTQKLWML